MSNSVKAIVGRALRETGAALKEAGGAEIFTRHRPSMMFMGNKPFKTNDTFIAPSASVIGNVTNWDESSVWYGAVVRADSHPITIGFSSCVQDRAVVTTLSPKVQNMKSGFPPVCHIGHYVSVGAGSILTSCRIEDLVEIGEKCIIEEGAVVEKNVVLEPGTVVPAYTQIPSGQRWAGNPATFVEELDEEAREHIKAAAEKTHLQAQEHALEFLPYGNTYVHLEELEKKGVQATQAVILTTRRAAAYQIKILLLKMFRAVALIVFTTSALVFAEEDGGYGSTQQHHYGGKYDEYPQQQHGGGYNQYPQQGYNQYPQQQQQYDPYHQPQYHAPAPVYPTPAPTKPYIVAAPATPPPDFVAPEEPYPVYHPEAQCNEKCKPNSAKYMAYVCSSLYASALKWGNNNCKGYYAVENAYNKNSLYQARLCTYWTQRSVMRVVTSCFIEAHLRNEFVMKHGKEGPGVWFCRYKEFVDQVLDCYKSSLKYYPLGAGMNNIEQTVAALYTPNKDDMPPFQFTGASVAMCAYYNNDQVYNRGSY